MISSESGEKVVLGSVVPSSVPREESTEEGLTRIIAEINAEARASGLIPSNRVKAVVEGADVAARDKPVECWLDGEEFHCAVMDYRGASPMNAHQAFTALVGLIRENVGRIRG